MNEQTFTITKFSDLANPTRFLALAARILPWLAALTAMVLAAGLYLSFTTDGDTSRVTPCASCMCTCHPPGLR